MDTHIWTNKRFSVGIGGSEGPQVAGSQTSEEDIEGCQNKPPQNMPFFHKDYFELKELKESAGAKRAF